MSAAVCSTGWDMKQLWPYLDLYIDILLLSISKDLWKRWVFSLEWKREMVMDGDSGDDEQFDIGQSEWSYLSTRQRYLRLVKLYIGPRRKIFTICRVTFSLRCTTVKCSLFDPHTSAFHALFWLAWPYSLLNVGLAAFFPHACRATWH